VNYYPKNLGDYARDTKHLTMLEHGAYNLLLDLLYATEKPLPGDAKEVARRIGVKKDAEVAATKRVLCEFFSFGPKGWTQKRFKEELKAYRLKSLHLSKNGKKGGRPPKANGKPMLSEKKANGKPMDRKPEPKPEPKTKPEKPVPFLSVSQAQGFSSLLGLRHPNEAKKRN